MRSATISASMTTKCPTKDREALFVKREARENPAERNGATGLQASLLRLRLGRQSHAQQPSLRALFHRKPPRERVILDAYRRHGYRLAEIAHHLGVHYATVSRWLRRAEQKNV